MDATAELFYDRFGGSLFTHELDSRTAPISRFDGVDDASLLRLAKELTRQFVDRLNIPLMRQISTHERKSQLRSIKLLESILGSISTQELARRTVPFW